MSADVTPSRRILAGASRVASVPLVLVYLAIGLVWRLVAAPFSPASGARGGMARWKRFAREGGAYLGWRTDRVPSLAGWALVEGASAGPWWEAKRRLKQSRIALWAWIGIAIYLYVGIAAQFGWIVPDFRGADRDAIYAAPQWFGGPYFLGTDQLGHDVFAYAIRGTTTALWIGTVAALLSCLIGTVLGALGGYFGGWVDILVVWLYTTLESIPYLLLLLAIAYVFKNNEDLRDSYKASFLAEDLHISLGLFVIVVAIGLTSWGGVCRTVRGEFIRQRDRDYVVAAHALGVPTSRIIFRHVLPNVFHLVLVSFSLLFISAVKFEVILSFLGMGLEEGEASWGLMISNAKLELLRDPTGWWQLTGATVFMFGLVLCVNLFSDALRDALDPRLKT